MSTDHDGYNLGRLHEALHSAEQMAMMAQSLVNRAYSARRACVPADAHLARDIASRLTKAAAVLSQIGAVEIVKTEDAA